MHIFISGATGFIGGILARRLAQNNESITLLTRNKDRVEPFLKSRAEILEGDFCSRPSLENLPPLQKSPEVLIHLAASLNYFGSKRYLNAVNVEGTVNLFNWAAEKGLKKFVFISSIEAMGTVDSGCSPANEEGICLPVSPYGESKLEAEKELKYLAKEAGVRLLILRLGNVYGPGSPSFIVPMANAILRKNKLLKFLPVYQDRYLHLVYIDDAVEGMVKGINDQQAQGIYILTGEDYITIKELFQLIAGYLKINMILPGKKNFRDALYLRLRREYCRLVGKADLLVYFTVGQKERIHRAYSTKKAKKDLGFSARMALKDGINRTLEWAEKEGLLIR